jgi:hypothetical protein
MLLKEIEWTNTNNEYSSVQYSQDLRRISDGTTGWRLYLQDKNWYWLQRERADDGWPTLLPANMFHNYDLFEAVCMLADFEPYPPTTTLTDEGNHDDETQV